MKRARTSTFKSGNSKQVKKTRLERPQGLISSLHPNAKGVRRSVTQTLNQTQLTQQHVHNEERVRAILTGMYYALPSLTVLTHAVIGYDQPIVELLRGSDGHNEDYGMDGPSAQAELDNNPADWVDEDMPVDSAFMDAIRDVSEMHVCVP